jgi:hypothetical protein
MQQHSPIPFAVAEAHLELPRVNWLIRKDKGY